MAQTIIEQLKQHRSIRKFTNRKIGDQLLKDVILAGQSASTSSNIQSVSVIRVKNGENRKRIAELSGKQWYVVDASEFLVFCADMNRASWCCEQSSKALAQGMTEHFILATVDVALFAQNVVVAAESEGLGICYIGGIRNDPKQVSHLLDLPANVYPVFGLCLGYPDHDPECKPRLPLEVVFMEERYQSVNRVLIEQYDETMRAYYRRRTNGKIDRSWSQEMSTLMSKESRPHMRKFLDDQGFEMN